MNYILVLIVHLLAIVASIYSRSITITVSEDELLLKNKESPKDWKTDNRYAFQWQGDFTYNVAQDSKCEKVILPKYGRLVCSTGEGLSRIMCLTECMKGYESVINSSVYLCTNAGQWLNLYKQPIAAPIFNCIKSPKREHFV